VRSINNNIKNRLFRLGWRLVKYIVMNKLSGQVLGRRSGNLARNQTAEVEEGLFKYELKIGFGKIVEYGKFWELGHKRKGKLYKRPFIKPSIEENKLMIKKEVVDILKENWKWLM